MRLGAACNQSRSFSDQVGVPRTGELIGLALERSVEMVVAIWRALKAGAGDICRWTLRYPPERSELYCGRC